jgi:hypothetical protein
MKKLLPSHFAFRNSIFVKAQEFQVPKDYAFESVDDYKPYENEVVKCVDWLVDTPMFQNPPKRKQASAFLLKWVMGSPYVHIEISPEIVSFAGTSPDLLMVFLGGWAKHSIESEAYNDKVAGNVAGLESVMEFYETNKGLIPKDKSVEKYMKMKKKGTLRDFVEKKV